MEGRIFATERIYCFMSYMKLFELFYISMICLRNRTKFYRVSIANMENDEDNANIRLMNDI